ncbi:MAG: hypothetical protein QXV20_05320 [Candidatus Hadarchaeales archaeon]
MFLETPILFPTSSRGSFSSSVSLRASTSATSSEIGSPPQSGKGWSLRR